MNLLTILNEDFKQLSTESKKKFPAIKEASDKAIVKLKSLGYESPDIVNLPKSDEVFNNLMSSLDVIINSQATDNATIQIQNKLLGIMISIMQSLVSNKAFAEDTRIPIVIDKLYALVEKARDLQGGDRGGESSTSIFSSNSGGENDFLNDENCVKISKLAVSLISTYTGLTGEYLLKSLKIAFLMSNIKNSKIVKSAACSSLMLIFTQIFGRARDEISENVDVKEEENDEKKEEEVKEDEKKEKEEKEEIKEVDEKEVDEEKKEEKEKEEEEKKEEEENVDKKESDDDEKEEKVEEKEEEKKDDEEKKEDEVVKEDKEIKVEETEIKEEEKKDEEKKVEEKAEKPKLSGILKDTFEVLSDVCFLTSRSIFEEGVSGLPTKREPSKYLKIERIDGLLGLDLISDILTNSYILFEKSPSFLHVLREDICKFLVLEKVKKILPISTTIGATGTGLLSKLKSKNARLLGHEFRVYQRILHICETLIVKDGYLVLIKSSSAYLFAIFDVLDKVLAAENPNNANAFLDAMQTLVLELFDAIFVEKLDKLDYGYDAPGHPNSISNLFFGKVLKDILAFVQFKRKNPKKKSEIPLFKYEPYPFQNSKISL